MFPAQRLQFACEFPVTAQRQVGFGPGLDRHQGQLGEMRSFGISEAGVRELGERLPPSQLQRLAQRGGRERHLPFLKQAPSLRHQLFKTGCVEIIRTDIEGIAGVGGDDRRGTEGTTQLADLGLQGVDRVGHLPVTPQRVDQQVRADGLSPMKRQQGQDRSLLGAPDRYRHAPFYCLELAEEPHLHTSTLRRPHLSSSLRPR